MYRKVLFPSMPFQPHPMHSIAVTLYVVPPALESANLEGTESKLLDFLAVAMGFLMAT